MLLRPSRQPALLMLVIHFALAAASSASFAADPVTLFNGNDLKGWLMGPDNAWVVENSQLTVKREYDGAEHNLDYLWTEKQYGDFVLELECKVADDTNSGIFIRTPNRKDPVYTGIEIQVANSANRSDLSKTQSAGAVYDCVAPSKNAMKPAGEWNRYVVTCKGPHITVVLNDQTVVEMDLDKWTEPNKNPDGTKNKFSTPMKDFARLGHIGLQDHGRRVWYRNVRVTELP